MPALVDYDELVLTVRELIEGTGRLVNFLMQDATPAETDKEWKPTGGTDESLDDVPATFVDPVSMKDMGMSTKDDDLFRRTQQVCLVAPNADAEDLKVYQQIEDGGAKWNILWIETLKPGDTILLYAFGLAR